MKQRVDERAQRGRVPFRDRRELSLHDLEDEPEKIVSVERVFQRAHLVEHAAAENRTSGREGGIGGWGGGRGEEATEMGRGMREKDKAKDGRDMRPVSGAVQRYQSHTGSGMRFGKVLCNLQRPDVRLLVVALVFADLG